MVIFKVIRMKSILHKVMWTFQYTACINNHTFSRVGTIMSTLLKKIKKIQILVVESWEELKIENGHEWMKNKKGIHTITKRIFHMKNPGLREALQATDKAGCLNFWLWKTFVVSFRHVSTWLCKRHSWNDKCKCGRIKNQ